MRWYGDRPTPPPAYAPVPLHRAYAAHSTPEIPPLPHRFQQSQTKIGSSSAPSLPLHGKLSSVGCNDSLFSLLRHVSPHLRCSKLASWTQCASDERSDWVRDRRQRPSSAPSTPRGQRIHPGRHWPHVPHRHLQPTELHPRLLLQFHGHLRLLSCLPQRCRTCSGALPILLRTQIERRNRSRGPQAAAQLRSAA